MRRSVLRAGLIGGFLLGGASPALAQTPEPLILHKSDDLTVTGHLQASAYGVAEQNLFWRFSETVAGAKDFDPNAAWFESYVKPGATFERRMSDRSTLYGGLSGVASMTIGTDAFDAGDTGRVTLEEGYLGWRYTGEDTSTDVSVGPREFKAGTGMLIESGGSNGFSRGALKLGPRSAWGFAALGQVERNGVKGTAFYLEPNESPDNDSGNRLAGLDLRYDPNRNTYLGMTAGKVVRSEAPYPQAAFGGIGPPTIIPGARDGLEFISFYARSPLPGLPNAFVTADLALERNDRIDMRAWGGRTQVGYVFADHPWKPTVTLGYQTFSGDDPNTRRLERFDPLYYEGSPASWSTGSKSAMVFINSNVNAWQLSTIVTPSPRDTVTLRLTRVGANELLSPIQFGQATRVDIDSGIQNPIAGVTRHHLSNDVLLEYLRVLTPNLYLTTTLSLSAPGAGIKSISDDAPSWTGASVTLTAAY